MTKFMSYMLRYGSAMNFFGGPGEAAHKFFVKAPALKTQRRAKEFARQTTEQYCYVMVSQYALRAILSQEESHNVLQNEWVNQNEDLSVNFCDKYSLVVTNKILLGMRNGNSIYVKWHSNRQGIQ